MQAKLKVHGGKNNGMLIDIPIAEFLIGRGPKAHLRPSSDLVSREHCVLTCADGKVRIKDLKSRNGTFVNEAKLEGETDLTAGDKVRIGRLVFEIVLDHNKPSVKKSPVDSAAAVGKRVASNASNGDWDDDSVSDWINDAPETTNEQSPTANSETAQFVLENAATQLFSTQPGDKSDATLDDTIQALNTDDTIDVSIDDKDKKSKDKSKSEPIKLPEQPKKVMAECTKSAADDVLRQFFNRR